MRKNKSSTANVDVANPDPQHHLSLYRTRFAELLNPAKAAARVADTFGELDHCGWAIRTVLTVDEVERLEQGGRAGHVQMELAQFSPGLPVVVLRALADEIELRIGVPLWLPGAQTWLFDVMDSEKMLLLADSVGGEDSIALSGAGKLLVDSLSLTAAVALSGEPEAKQSLHHMTLAGLRLLHQDTPTEQSPYTERLAVRVAVAGQGRSAFEVVAALKTMEAAKVKARGRDDGVCLEGPASPRSRS